MKVKFKKDFHGAINGVNSTWFDKDSVREIPNAQAQRWIDKGHCTAADGSEEVSGGDGAVDLSKLKKSELQDLAEEKGLDWKPSMTVAQLIEVIEAAE